MLIFTDSDAVIIETEGERLGFNQDKRIYKYFRSHFTHFFPALREIYRTSFVYQAASLWLA
jgi:hypothetical protein